MDNTKEPIRIAQIIGKWVGGGVEAVVMNYYRHIDKNKIQFDFICDEDSTNIPYEEIEKLGGKVILIPPYQKLFQYHKQLKKVLKEGKYQIVHSHINTLSVFSLCAAKCAKVPVRIAHSHSTTNKKEKKKNLMKKMLKPFSKLFATDYMCCSELAGRWLFGNKLYNERKIYLLNNAIDLNKFEYNEKIREEVRKELNIDKETFIIGHIGRFVEQKNHAFLIDTFHELHKEKPNSMLMLVGQGPLQDAMKAKVKQLGLENSVLFLGQRNDANRLYQAMDVFVLPSLYEGLGMVLIEAQCAGLPCIASTEVPTIAKTTENIAFVDLSKSYKEWSEKIVELHQNVERKDHSEEVKMAGYDIENEVEKLEKKYSSFITKESIELFGVPACGKSVYAMSTLNYLKDYNSLYINQKSRFLRNVQRAKCVLHLFLFKNRDFRNICATMKDFKFASITKKIKMFVYYCNIYYLIIKYKKNQQSALFDEGMIQVLWGICYNSNYSKESILNFIDVNKSMICDEVYCFKVDREILYERLMQRSTKGGSELEHNVKDNKENLDRAIAIYNDILDELENKDIKIKFVENGGNK